MNADVALGLYRLAIGIAGMLVMAQLAGRWLAQRWWPLPRVPTVDFPLTWRQSLTLKALQAAICLFCAFGYWGELPQPGTHGMDGREYGGELGLVVILSLFVAQAATPLLLKLPGLRARQKPLHRSLGRREKPHNASGRRNLLRRCSEQAREPGPRGELPR